MTWIARKKANVDRIACLWLIKRFVDAAAAFLYVPACQLLETPMYAFCTKLASDGQVL